MLCQKIKNASQTSVPCEVFTEMDRKNHPTITKVSYSANQQYYVHHRCLLLINYNIAVIPPVGTSSELLY